MSSATRQPNVPTRPFVVTVVLVVEETVQAFRACSEVVAKVVVGRSPDGVETKRAENAAVVAVMREAGGVVVEVCLITMDGKT